MTSMRRKEKEITDIDEIESIIRKADVCRLGLAVDNTPYVVPVNYGYEDRSLYIHCAKEGRKIDMIKQNNNVCFQLDVDTVVTGRDKPPCQWSSSYRSVIGYGEAFFIEDFHQKKQALDIIMKHYSPKTSFEYREEAIEKVAVIKIIIRHLTGKTASANR